MSRSDRKRAAIITAARAVFLRNGFGAASVDEIAAIAAVSKVTIYKNFADKQALFTATILDAIAETEERGADELAALSRTDDLERDLLALAREMLNSVLAPDVIRMRRVLIGEAERFPELARTWYQQGPERTYDVLGDIFVQLAARGLLVDGDNRTAAAHFTWLVLSVPLNAVMFGAGEQDRTDDAQDQYARAAVTAFLAAYRP